MSELQPSHHEQSEAIRNPESSAEHQKNVERASLHHEKAAEHAKHLNVEHVQHKVETLATESKAHINEHSKNVTASFGSPLASKQVKDTKYQHTLSSIQKKLPAPARGFSKVIHNQTVESLSDAGAKTVARPYALLSGGLFALLGSSFFLYFAKKYGWRYNFGIFILCFAGGYALGLLLDLSIRLIQPKTRQQ